MSTIYTHFLCEFPAQFTLFNNRDLFSINSNQCLSKEIDIQIEGPEDFSIFIYPLNEKNKISYRVDFEYSNEELISKNKLAKVYKLPENHFFILFTPFFVKKDEFIADKIEIHNNEIKKLSNLNDMNQRGKVEIFKIENDKLVKAEEYFVMLENDTPPIEASADLILLSFFEAIFSHDYQFARESLSVNLSNKLTDENLKNFFGDFNCSILVNYYTSPAVVIFYNDKATVFSANFQDGKIVDIYEIN